MDLKEIMKKMFDTANKNDEEKPERSGVFAAGRPVDPLAVLTKIGIEDGYITEGERIGIALDLAERREEVCMQILSGLQEELKPDYNKPEERYACLCWAAYAGIGAAYLCCSLLEKVFEKGIYETLLAGSALGDLDDSVTAMTGFSASSGSESADLAEHLLRCASELDDGISGFDRYRIGPAFFECMCAMYVYGLLLENSRLLKKGSGRKLLN